MRRPGKIVAMWAAGVLALALPGCGSSHAKGVKAHGGGGQSSAAATTPATSGGPVASGTGSGACRRVPAPAPKGPQHLPPPSLRLDPRRTYTVTVVTNCGSFAFTLDVRLAPRTAASFFYLVKRGFFDGLTFHRVAAGFVIQGGDPNGDGSGGPGYTIVEPPLRELHYLRGDVAMAKSADQPPGASGSQFFIVTTADATLSAGLTADYALVGKVVSGQNVVQAIGALPTNPPQDGAPVVPVVMSRVTVKVT